MRIILLKEVENLGKVNDIVDVKDGYARNYLFPLKIAIQATPANLTGLKKSLERFSKRVEKTRRTTMSLAEKINTLSMKTTIKIGIDGKSFGSITAQNLVDLLKTEGIEINKKNIMLDEPIKHPGVYDINVHLPEKIKAIFKLIVVEEEG